LLLSLLSFLLLLLLPREKERARWSSPGAARRHKTTAAAAVPNAARGRSISATLFVRFFYFFCFLLFRLFCLTQHSLHSRYRCRCRCRPQAVRQHGQHGGGGAAAGGVRPQRRGVASRLLHAALLRLPGAPVAAVPPRPHASVVAPLAAALLPPEALRRRVPHRPWLCHGLAHAVARDGRVAAGLEGRCSRGGRVVGRCGGVVVLLSL
jgi:hypothetical protein